MLTWLTWAELLQEGGPLQGPKLGSCLTVGNELSEETHADKAKYFIGKGHPGGEQEGKGTQENCSAAWLAVSGFMVMGLVSGWLWPIILIQSLSWWSHTAQPRWMLARGVLEVDGQAGSPLDLSRTLQASGGLLVLYSLSGSPVIKQLMQMVTMVPGQGGRFQSVCFP